MFTHKIAMDLSVLPSRSATGLFAEAAAVSSQSALGARPVVPAGHAGGVFM
jgi:hypothetical protein